jgi:hypothetical protein
MSAIIMGTPRIIRRRYGSTGVEIVQSVNFPGQRLIVHQPKNIVVGDCARAEIAVAAEIAFGTPRGKPKIVQ